MIKKILLFLLFITSLVYSQEGIKYTADYVTFSLQLDSTDLTGYTQRNIFFEKGYGDKWFPGGDHTFYFFTDTIETDDIPSGDTDSLFVYYKMIAPNDSIAVNDSTFLTPNCDAAGLDFNIRETYVYEVTPLKGKGLAFYFKRHARGAIAVTGYVSK